MISPLQCAPKRDSTEPRIVHDLSFPPDGSVNSRIPSDSFLNEPYKLTSPGIDRLVEFVNRLGRGCHIFKKDLKRAYRQIPVGPADYHLLGMCISGSFSFHTTLPFGLRSATMACQRTIKAVAHILNNHGILADVYIDDLYGAARPETLRTDFACMNRIFSELGLQASPDKDIPPCCEMTCFGGQFLQTVKRPILHTKRSTATPWQATFRDLVCPPRTCFHVPANQHSERYSKQL